MWCQAIYRHVAHLQHSRLLPLAGRLALREALREGARHVVHLRACGCVHCSEAFVEQKATAWQDGGAAGGEV